jgi:hypothetical protein
MAKVKLSVSPSSTAPAIVITIILVVIGILWYISSRNEGFTSYHSEYGMLNDSIANGNPISWEGKTANQLATRTIGTVGSLDKYQKINNKVITYQGHGVPLKNEEYKTTPEGKSKFAFDGRECRPECCYGSYPSGYSCDRGCICGDGGSS